MTAATSIGRAHEALRAGRRACIVHHARLRPADEQDAAQMRFAVEDALNTADFGDYGRLVVVRRMRVNAVPRGASPALMARALEGAWRSLAAQAVPPSHPQARDADAVFFASPFEARVAWLKLVATHADASGWFWRAALPELQAPAAADDPQVAIEVVIDALLRESVGETLRTLREWPDAATAALARRLTEPANRRLLELVSRIAMTGRAPSPQARHAQGLAQSRETSPAWRGIARRLAHQAPLSETAASWITGLWLAPLAREQPTLQQIQDVVAMAFRFTRDERVPIAPPAASARLPTAPEVAASIIERQTRSRQGGFAVTVTVEPAPGARQESGALPAASQMESGLRADTIPAHVHRDGFRSDRPALPWLADAAPTDHGGLMFLVNLLQAVRFDAWLAGQMPQVRHYVVDALFADVLSACGAPPDDPQQAWFEPPPAHASRAVRLWHLRMRRALRRQVGMDLSAVVLRSAWVCATATHVDVLFPLGEVDLRLRRRGLDSDPGWVAWLGRVVTFHFVASELLPQRDPEPGAASG